MGRMCSRQTLLVSRAGWDPWRALNAWEGDLARSPSRSQTGEIEKERSALPVHFVLQPQQKKRRNQKKERGLRLIFCTKFNCSKQSGREISFPVTMSLSGCARVRVHTAERERERERGQERERGRWRVYAQRRKAPIQSLNLTRNSPAWRKMC